jgi:hypothetical protein
MQNHQKIYKVNGMIQQATVERVSTCLYTIIHVMGLVNPWFISRHRKEIFLVSKTSITALRPTQLLSQWVPGSLLGVKQPRYDPDQSPPLSAKVKNEWSYTHMPPLCFHDTDKDFAFYLLLSHCITNKYPTDEPNQYELCSKVKVFCVF